MRTLDRTHPLTQSMHTHTYTHIPVHTNQRKTELENEIHRLKCERKSLVLRIEEISQHVAQQVCVRAHTLARAHAYLHASMKSASVKMLSYLLQNRARQNRVQNRVAARESRARPPYIHTARIRNYASMSNVLEHSCLKVRLSLVCISSVPLMSNLACFSASIIPFVSNLPPCFLFFPPLLRLILLVSLQPSYLSPPTSPPLLPLLPTSSSSNLACFSATIIPFVLHLPPLLPLLPTSSSPLFLPSLQPPSFLL